jgi:hypothetical protein
MLLLAIREDVAYFDSSNLESFALSLFPWVDCYLPNDLVELLLRPVTKTFHDVILEKNWIS